MDAGLKVGEISRSARYYQEHKDNWDFYCMKQDICPISRTASNLGRSCPLRNMCLRKDKGKYKNIC